MNMKKIIFTKGDETRPKLEDLRNEETLKSSIFEDVYDRAFSLIEEIANTTDIENSRYNRERNNIIAFIGERGSGKTSCMKSLYYSLHKEKNKLPSRIVKTAISFNNQLPIIDPSYLDEQSDIIEIIIAHMFQLFRESVNRNSHSFDGDKLEKKRLLIKRFEAVKEALNCTKTSAYNIVSDDSIEQLSLFASGSNLHNSMEQLVKTYLDYFKAEEDDMQQILVIAIDDLDVQTNRTYQMVEQIRKYLIIDNVIILMGVKLVQLSELIKKKYLEDFSNKNYNTSELKEQIDDMVARYLTKFLPLSHRLILPSYHEIPEVALSIRLTESDNKSLITRSPNCNVIHNEPHIDIHDSILALIYSKTAFMFYNTIEQENMIVPHNLRELLNLIALLNNMNDRYKKKNRSIFRQYFIESWCLDRLTSRQHVFIKEILECDSVSINKFIIDYIYKEYKSYFESQTAIDSSVISSTNRCYNVSIADVNYMLNLISNINNTSIKRLVFAIKTVYSLLLYDKYEMMIKRKNEEIHTENLYRYLSESSMSNILTNKLSHIYDYEKMLGGNIINISGKISDNTLRYVGTIKAQSMNKLYADIIDSKSVSSSQLNTFELFLLSTTYYGSPCQNPRSFKMCHYNSFPIEDYPDNDVVVFNFTALLLNTLRFVNLHKKFKCIEAKIKSLGESIVDLKSSPSDENMKIITQYEKNIDSYKSSVFYKFFDFIYRNKDNSIIYHLVTNHKSINAYHVLLNLEHLNLLDHYLGRLDKNRNVNSLDAIKFLIDKCARYEYHTYNVKRGKLINPIYSLHKLFSEDIYNLCIAKIEKIEEDTFNKIYNSINE